MKTVYENEQKKDKIEIEETVEFKQPDYISGTMRDYQLKGLKWLIGLYDQNVSGCILGGKTEKKKKFFLLTQSLKE